MYLFNLQAKLKRVNPQLLILTDQGRDLTQIRSFPLVLRFGSRKLFNPLASGYVNSEVSKYIAKKESGQAGEYICGVSDWSPEYDMFDIEKGSLIARGYRSLAKLLADKKVAPLDRIKKIFQVPDLGQTDYDRSSFEKRLEWARKEKR